ncbi:hypothetical protein V6N13_121889 [Hibiscus sabdariffa]
MIYCTNRDEGMPGEKNGGLNISSAILVLYATQKNFWATKGDPFTVKRFFHGLPFQHITFSDCGLLSATF